MITGAVDSIAMGCLAHVWSADVDYRVIAHAGDPDRLKSHHVRVQGSGFRTMPGWNMLKTDPEGMAHLPDPSHPPAVQSEQ